MGIPQPHRRADLSGQRAAYAPPGAETGWAAQDQVPRSRHTFATLALQNGVDVKTVSGMRGHFSAEFTLDTYAHVTTASQRQAAKTMGSVISGSFQS